MTENMLNKQSCVPCGGEIPPLTVSAAEALLTHTPEWVVFDNHLKIQRHFSFKNFVDALAFANTVGEICEAEFHHPDMTLGWGYCRVEFYSHKIKGLHENDFIMAAKVSKLYDDTYC